MKPWIYLVALALSAPAFADDTIVFRCTDANGEVAVQDGPCPPGTAQIIQRRDASATSTASTALGEQVAVPPAPVLDSDLLPALQAGAATGSGDAILDSDVIRARVASEAAPPKPPLPAIFRCVGNDTGQYLHELEPAPPRCGALAISGLGGSIAPDNATSCEVLRDDCTAVDEPQRCSAWQQRFRNARGRERFAPPESQTAAAAERERLQAVLEASDCPVPL